MYCGDEVAKESVDFVALYAILNGRVSEVGIEGSPRPRLLPAGHRKILMVLRVSTAVLDIHVMGSDWIVVGSDDSNRHTSETRRAR
jgi:hypothetical protein